MSVTILIGDVFDRLRKLPADSFDCVVTSPPYWGLRDYGVAGQIGLEPTLGEHLDVMVRVFAEVHRVLKPTGVLFLNYGDCYATSPNGRSAADTKASGKDDRTFRDKPFSTIGPIGGAPHAQGYDSAGTEGSGSQGRGSSSQNRGGARKGSASSRTTDSDVGRALELTRGPLTQIQASMRSLLAHLPSAGSEDQTELRQSSSAMLDQAPALALALETLLAALASTTAGSSTPRPEDSRLSDITSACLSSLRSCEFGVREFVRMSGEPSERPPHTEGSASPSEALEHCIRCTAACCSLLASWEDIEPERTSGLGAAFEPQHESGDRRGKSGNKGSAGQQHHGGRVVGQGPVLKPKDLCMIPNRLAIALQEWGWWVRSEIVWAKPNPMPDSSGKYRPSTSHEKIFLLTKTGKGFYDSEAVAQPVSENTHARLSQDVANQIGSARANGGAKTNGNMKAVIRGRSTYGRHTLGEAVPVSDQRKLGAEGSNIKGKESFYDSTIMPVDTRYLRNFEPAPPAVWVMATQSFKEAHFATFPPELVERCLKAGCPKGGSVLDPFGGAGTTALVADQMQLDATIIELNPDYVHIAARRIEADRGPIQNALDPLNLIGAVA